MKNKTIKYIGDCLNCKNTQATIKTTVDGRGLRIVEIDCFYCKYTMRSERKLGGDKQ